MLALDALAHLEAVAAGQPLDPDALRQLVKLGLAFTLEPSDARRCAELDELESRYGLLDAASLASRIEKLTRDLRSDMHRMLSFKTTIQQQEKDRGLAKRLLPLVSDPEENARLQAARVDYKELSPDRPACLSPKGRRLLPALRARAGRFGGEPLASFLKVFDKSESRMESLVSQVDEIKAKLGPVEKGRDDVVIGLLKSGLAPADAVESWRKACNAGLPYQKPREVAHLATATVRLGSADVHATAQRQRDAIAALNAAGLPDGPVLRGASRAVVAYDGPEPVQRFVALFNAFHGHLGDPTACLRHAGRMLACAGEPEALVERCAAIAGMRGLPRIDAAAVALASHVTPELPPDAAIERFAAIGAALVRAGAFEQVPDAVVDLVPCKGTPDEVAAVVGQFVAHLQPRKKKPWLSPDLVPLAVSCARRLMY